MQSHIQVKALLLNHCMFAKSSFGVLNVLASKRRGVRWLPDAASGPEYDALQVPGGTRHPGIGVSPLKQQSAQRHASVSSS